MSRWLVIGGAGYVGSHVLHEFVSHERECVVLDNLSRGFRNRIPSHLEFIKGEAADSELIVAVCKRYKIDSVLHFAAYMQARESVRDPIKYWDNNLNATLGIAKALEGLNIDQLIFSSSCSVYGNNSEAQTDSELTPLSPYAMTKVACEQILSQACIQAQTRLSIMRYFNVIGCGDFEFSLDASIETLVPSILRALTSNLPFQIYGNSFNTIDGTALRDYLDVRDLARAHLAASQITSVVNPVVYNVSSGLGTTVKQIVEILLSLTNSEINFEFHDSKPGDPAVIAAKPSQALLEFGWSADIPIETSLLDYVKNSKRHREKKGFIN
jgi:UDP-glucose 4-epimerase